MIGEAKASGKYTCVAKNEDGNSTMTIPFYVDGKWVTRIQHKKIADISTFQI